jgi:hypothetical protein
MPGARSREPQRPPAESWQELAHLRNRGVIDDAEADALRRRMEM